MWGFIVAVIAGAVAYFTGGVDHPEAAFTVGTAIFFVWHFVWSIVGLALATFVILGLVSVTTVAGGRAFGLKGWLSGSIGGTAFGLVVLSIIVLSSVMLLSGAYLLNNSVSLSGEEYVWNTKRVIIGSILVAIPFLVRGETKSSN